jgi:hypothetical protein
MVAALGPIGLVIAGILLLTAGFVYFFGFTETGQKLWAIFTEALITRFNTVGRQVAITVNFIIARFESMINAAVKALNFLSQQANKLDGINIPMIAEVSFGRVEIPEVYTKPIEYTFPTKAFGAGTAFQAGANDRLTGGGQAGNMGSNIPMNFGMPSLLGATQGLGQNFRYEGPQTGFQGRSAGGGATYNNAVTVNQGIMSGVGTSEAEAGRVIQQYLNAYSRTGGK